jgi:P-type Cu+ transporter
MTTDPVCGMEIEADDAVAQSSYEGETYYFCSTECKKKFDQDPELYVGEGEEEEETVE